MSTHTTTDDTAQMSALEPCRERLRLEKDYHDGTPLVEVLARIQENKRPGRLTIDFGDGAGVSHIRWSETWRGE